MIEIPGYHGGLMVPHRDVRVIKQGWTEQSLTNSTTAITIVSTTIPANLMGPNGSLRFTTYGHYINNAASTKVLRCTLSFGGTTFWNDADAPPTDASERAYLWQGQLFNRNAVNSNRFAGFWMISYPNLVDTGLAGDIGRAYSNVRGGPTTSGTQSINTAANQTFLATVTMSTTDPNTTLYNYGYMLEICPGA